MPERWATPLALEYERSECRVRLRSQGARRELRRGSPKQCANQVAKAAASFARSTSCDVHDQEHDHPHDIDEMPVQREHVASRCMDWPHVAMQREDRPNRETCQADRHMERME